MKRAVNSVLIAICVGLSSTALAQSLKLPHIAADEFMAGWQQKPSRSLAFLIEKLNATNAVTEAVTSVRLQSSQGVMDEPYQLIPKFESDGLVIDIRVHPRFVENPLVLFEIMNDLKSFSNYDMTSMLVQVPQPSGRNMARSIFDVLNLTAVNYRDVQTPIQWAELELSARAGDKFAQLEALKNHSSTRNDSQMSLSGFLFASNQIDPSALTAALGDLAEFRSISLRPGLGFNEAWSEYNVSLLNQIHAREALLSKEAQRVWSQVRKQNADTSELKRVQEEGPEKLDALVKANDRTGVARLLELYLPWSEMSPIENGLWKNWVEAIRHPNANDSIILYRGIGLGEPLIETRNSQGPRSGRAMLSTLLTKNQGNYTRRLRSLTTMRYRLGFRKNSKSTDVKSPLENAPKMTSIMINHSRDPVGSPFLSFSTKANVAYGFGEREVLAVKMDRRRILPNIASTLKHELEMLVPLIVFPDEVIHFTKEPATREAIDKFQADSLAKAGSSAREWSAGIERGSAKESFVNAYRLFEDATFQGVTLPACRAAFR
jgi:hypothetical protein